MSKTEVSSEHQKRNTRAETEYRRDIRQPSNKLGTAIHPLTQAVVAGSSIDVQILLENLDSGAPDVVLREDDKGRNSLHMAAMGSSATIVKLLLKSYETYVLRDVRDEELEKVEAEKLATLNILRTQRLNSQAPVGWKDPRHEVVDEWFKDEISRINRLMELKKEEWWVRALSSVDKEGQSALHYLAANDSLVAHELLREITRSGQGTFRSTSQYHGVKIGKTGKKQSPAHALRAQLNESSLWFTPNTMYNSITGHEIGHSSKQSGPSTSAFSEPKRYASESFEDLKATIDAKGVSLGQLSLPMEVSANYEIIVPWLLRNMNKRASVLQAGAKEEVAGWQNLLEMATSISRDEDLVLIAPQFRELLARLGIRVTKDVIREVCRLYSADAGAIREKWRAAKAKAEMRRGAEKEKRAKELSDLAGSKDVDTGRYPCEGKSDGEAHSFKGERSGAGIDRDAKREAKTDESLLTGEEEDLGVDMRKLVDDIRSGRGMKSVDGLLGGMSLLQARKIEIGRLAACSPMPCTAESKESKESDEHCEEKRCVDSPMETNEEQKVEKDLEAERASGLHHSASSLLPGTVSLATLMRLRKGVIDLQDNSGRTPLFIAAAMGHKDLVMGLLQNHADVTVQVVSYIAAKDNDHYPTEHYRK